MLCGWRRCYVSNLKSQVGLLHRQVYFKQPILGLTQEFCWVRVRRRVAFETFNYRDEVSARKVIVN